MATMVWRAVGASLCAWAVLGGSSARANADACSVTEAALRQVLGTASGRTWELEAEVFDGSLKLFLSVEALRQDFPDADPDDPNLGWVVAGDESVLVAVDPPSKEMAQAFIEQARVSATACSNILQYAEGSGIVVQPGAKARRRRQANGLYDRTVVALTKAIISPDGSEALVYVTTASGPLAGGGRLLLFRRGDGELWRFAGQLGLFVS